MKRMFLAMGVVVLMVATAPILDWHFHAIERATGKFGTQRVAFELRHEQGGIYLHAREVTNWPRTGWSSIQYFTEYDPNRPEAKIVIHENDTVTFLYGRHKETMQVTRTGLEFGDEAVEVILVEP